MKRFFPKIDFVGEMPEAVIHAVPYSTKETLVGCYIYADRGILIVRGRGFKKTVRTILHELGHWGIELFVGPYAKHHKWLDKRFSSKEF